MATRSGNMAVEERRGSLEWVLRTSGSSRVVVGGGGGVCDLDGEGGEGGGGGEFCSVGNGERVASSVGVEVDFEVLRSFGVVTVNFRGARKLSVFHTPEP